MKKLLHIVLGEISTGELSIAISFQKNLDKNKNITHYLIPENKSGVMGTNNSNTVITISRDNAPKANQEYILELFKNQKYDLIILFDIFTFEYAQDWTGINCDILMEQQIPVVSLDEYEYTKAGYQLDYYGMFIKRLPPLLDKCDFVIKNCPLSMIENANNCLRQGIKKNEYYYRIFDAPKRISYDKKISTRKKYITENESVKVVFFTTSQWEVEGAYSFSCQSRLVTWLGVLLFEYLKLLNEDIVLLHVGSGQWNISSTDSKVKYVHYNSFPVDEFENILQSVDLFVTFNLVSITLSKAILFGIPSLVLNNSKIIDFSRLSSKLLEKPQWYQDMASDVKKIYPFTASMFGWSHFLETVMKNNKYIDTFIRTEFFNLSKTVNIFHQLLYDEEFRIKLLDKNEEFMNNYYNLLTANDVIEDIFSNLEEREY